MMYVHSAIHQEPMPRLDREYVENDTKTIVWTENILFVFGEKTPFSNLSGLV